MNVPNAPKPIWSDAAELRIAIPAAGPGIKATGMEPAGP
jgi:hypothetical protein